MHTGGVNLLQVVIKGHTRSSSNWGWLMIDVNVPSFSYGDALHKGNMSKNAVGS
jgi:hypothetical protein